MIRRLPAESPGILCFRGPDAERYLNGQLTQDVAKLGESALPSCVTDAKGRLQFYVTVVRGPEQDEWWVVGDPDRTSELRGRLERYLVADDVEVSDLGGRWLRVHAEGDLGDADFTRAAFGPFGGGVEHWYREGRAPSGTCVPPGEAEALRIQAGLPAWGAELEEGMLPPEAGLDRTAVDYRKGCYIGQEVLSRMKTAGRVNRRLARFLTEAEGPGPLLAGGTEVGRLTSVSPLAGDGGERPALGYLGKHAFDLERFEAPGGTIARFTGWA